MFESIAAGQVTVLFPVTSFREPGELSQLPLGAIFIDQFLQFVLIFLIILSTVSVEVRVGEMKVTVRISIHLWFIDYLSAYL